MLCPGILISKVSLSQSYQFIHQLLGTYCAESPWAKLWGQEDKEDRRPAVSCSQSGRVDRQAHQQLDPGMMGTMTKVCATYYAGTELSLSEKVWEQRLLLGERGTGRS